MKRVSQEKKRFLINRQVKIMRQRMRKNKNKRRRIGHNIKKEGIHVDTDSVKKILETCGFGKDQGKRILKENGVLAKINKTHIYADNIIIKVPEVLSISEDSDSALEFLHECYGLIVNNNISRISFDHTGCRKLGLSASTFMDVVIMTAKAVIRDRNKNNQRNELILGGVTKSDSDISRILMASGLPKHLNASWLSKEVARDNDIDELDIITGYSGRKNRMSSSNATLLTLYFQKCLYRESLTLTGKGKRYFTELFGEVLANCEIHGGKDGTWYTQGIYLKKDYGGEMQLLFMNIGDTIYDGLMKHSTDETRARLDKLYARHRRYISETWTKEMLYTLFALQDGISRYRDRNSEDYGNRGSGTVTMINAFQTIGARIEENVPQMTIVSGNTRIVFTDTYQLEEKKFDDDIMGHRKRKVIAFNRTNDLYLPPDSQNVKKCKYKFPGTVISLRFVLNKEYVTRAKGDVGSNG